MKLTDQSFFGGETRSIDEETHRPARLCRPYATVWEGMR